MNLSFVYNLKFLESITSFYTQQNDAFDSYHLFLYNIT